ncbi:MAG: metalloregulator ArsR/SmtB family transcription factor [Rhodobacter sp.]|nr:metalloregulator ArsR/SmtB family transcription factor [Rhodobacter sp.]
MTRIEDTAMAKQFKALAHPRRMRIFRLLAEQPEVGRSFLSLQETTRLCHSSLSHHLREMVLCGVIRRRRRGTYMTFSLETSALTTAIREVLHLRRPRSVAARRAA